MNSDMKAQKERKKRRGATWAVMKMVENEGWFANAEFVCIDLIDSLEMDRC